MQLRIQHELVELIFGGDTRQLRVLPDLDNQREETEDDANVGDEREPAAIAIEALFGGGGALGAGASVWLMA
ncbi:MAG: hypothetical protein IPL62_20290 [Caulobacteraceae bacterium]|nr:hypothetical protein [Caulobacteraceae bacterium]